VDSLRATRLNNQQFYVLHTHSVFMFFFFWCGSENNQRLFPYTALTDWFL